MSKFFCQVNTMNPFVLVEKIALFRDYDDMMQTPVDEVPNGGHLRTNNSSPSKNFIYIYVLGLYY